MKFSVKQIMLTALTIPALLLFVLTLGQTRAMVASTEDGAALYKAKCAMCHAADGSGSTSVGKSLKVPNLRSGEVQGKSEVQLYNIIATGKGKMPAYGKSLGDQKVHELVA